MQDPCMPNFFINELEKSLQKMCLHKWEKKKKMLINPPQNLFYLSAAVAPESPAGH